MKDDITNIAELPATLPVFPLSRVVLLPGIQLPLNIFEPRYLAMVDHAMKTNRLIGMIQPKAGGNGSDLFRTGCVGRITAFEETEDGRYLILLRGICRFDIESEEVLDAGGFRVVRPAWEPYKNDLSPPEENEVCREAMLKTLKPYLANMDMSCDQWESMRNIGCDRLVSTLTMICPFSADEKQMLLEAATLADRMKVLRAFLESAVMEDSQMSANDDMGPPSRCH